MRHRPPARAGWVETYIQRARAGGRRAFAIVAYAGMLAIATLPPGVLLAGCVAMAPGQRSPDDPLEPLNRAVFDVNTALDDSLIRPVAEAYRAIVPVFVRDRIR